MDVVWVADAADIVALGHLYAAAVGEDGLTLDRLEAVGADLANLLTVAPAAESWGAWRDREVLEAEMAVMDDAARRSAARANAQCTMHNAQYTMLTDRAKVPLSRCRLIHGCT